MLDMEFDKLCDASCTIIFANIRFESHKILYPASQQLTLLFVTLDRRRLVPVFQMNRLAFD
jgi:hypothetical protein